MGLFLRVGREFRTPVSFRLGHFEIIVSASSLRNLELVSVFCFKNLQVIVLSRLRIGNLFLFFALKISRFFSFLDWEFGGLAEGEGQSGGPRQIQVDAGTRNVIILPIDPGQDPFLIPFSLAFWIRIQSLKKSAEMAA